MNNFHINSRNKTKGNTFSHTLFLIVTFISGSAYFCNINSNNYIIFLTVFMGLIIFLPLIFIQKRFISSIYFINPLNFFVAGLALYYLAPFIFWLIGDMFSLSSILYGQDFSDPFMKQIINKTGICIIVGIISTWIGFFICKFQKHIPKVNKLFMLSEKKYFNSMIPLVFIFLGIASYMLKIKMIGGLSAIRTVHWADRMLNTSNPLYPYISYMTYCLDAGVIYLFLSRRFRRNLSYIMLVAGTLILDNFVGSTRVTVIRLFIILASSYLFLNHKKIKLPLTLIVSAIIITCFIYLIVWGALRNVGMKFDKDTWINLYFIGDKLDFPMLFDNFLLVSLNIPLNISFLYGSSYYRVLFFPIPRFIWPNKPIDIGTWISLNLRQGINSDVITSAAPTGIGEMYLNFGYIGVALISLVLGYAIRIAYEFHIRNIAHQNLKGTLMGMIISMFLFEFSRGGLAYLVLVYVLIMLPFFIDTFLKQNSKKSYNFGCPLKQK